MEGYLHLRFRGLSFGMAYYYYFYNFFLEGGEEGCLLTAFYSIFFCYKNNKLYRLYSVAIESPENM